MIFRIIVMALIIAAGSLALYDQYEPVKTCEEAQARLGGEPLEWLGYEYGGWLLPDDLEMVDTYHFLTDGGVWRYHSASENADYIWWFLDYVADGNPRGNHHFCAFVVTNGY